MAWRQLVRQLGIELSSTQLLLFSSLTRPAFDMLDCSCNSFSPIGFISQLELCLGCLACAALLWPLLVWDRCLRPMKGVRMPPRRQLHRMWLVLRLYFGVFLVGNALLYIDGLWPLQKPIGKLAPDWLDTLHGGRGRFISIISFASFALAALAFSPRNRGRVLRRLHDISSTRGSKEQEAASVAALLGSRGAAATLAKACGRFRALPLDVLSRAELMNNKPDPQMHGKTVEARLGEVDAFASHSWSDDGDAKFDTLHKWAGVRPTRVWLDKACIDQNNIDASLACLPVFLSGCRKLLCLVGPSYTSRLWCVMELFVFVRMHGKREDIVVRLLGEQTADLKTSLAKFDAARARCFLDKDRQGLLAVIEAAYGTMEPFNTYVREIFRTTVDRSSRQLPLQAGESSSTKEVMEEVGTRSRELDNDEVAP